MKLLDTAVAIDHLRGAEQARELFGALVASGERVAASEVVRFELVAGVRDAELEALEEFFTFVTWLHIDEPIARLAGTLARTYGSSHGGIDDSDYLIGATSLYLDTELLTTNVKHFPMLEGLQPAY